MKELTGVQIEFLNILKSFIRNKLYQLPEKFEEVAELFKLSQEHHMAAAVYEQIQGEAIWKKTEYQNLHMAWKRETILGVTTQMQRTSGFLALYEKLCDAGLKPLVVKGLICRNMYYKPDYRVSGDEDMLLHRSDMLKCDEILLRDGYRRKELDLEHPPYEISYINPQNGVYIEVHFSLFPEESGAYGHLNEEFQKVFEHSVCEFIQGKKVWTLCPTEHLFYLICHSFKHFLHSGFGLRQVCDMILMAEKYGEQIDWSDLKERLGRLKMRCFWDALVKIGVEFLGFSYEKSGYPKEMQDSEVDCRALLADLMDSGIYGDSSMERKHSSNMTLTAAAGGKSNMAASIRNSLFPGMKYMKEGFPWLVKNPWLLPVAYIIRVIRYLKTYDKENVEQNSMQIGMGRVELLKQYHIID